MNVKLLSTLLLATLSLPTQAAQDPAGDQRATSLNPVSAVAPKPIGGQRAIVLLALETELTPRLVRTVMTHDPLQYYAFGFQKNAERQFKATLGEDRYSALMAGQSIELSSPQVREAVQSWASTSHADTSSVLVAVAE